MKRAFLLALTLWCGAALISSLGVATAATRATGAKITLEKTKKFGKILANGKGFTVYAYSKDTPGHQQCQNVSKCTQLWPPVITKGKPVAGPGVHQSKLGTIKLKNGKLQVTYKGHPLYLFKLDHNSGQIGGQRQNIYGGKWYAVSASGAANKLAPPSGGTTTGTTTGTTCGIYGCTP